MPAVPYLIMAGAQIVGSKINANAQGNAADKQAAGIEKGIALQDKMYTQDRADLSGARDLFNGAVGNLAYLGGINMPAASTAPATPAPVPPPSLGSLGLKPGTPIGNVAQQSLDRINDVQTRINNGQAGPTTKVTKNGVTRVIPTSLLTKARQEGFQEVVS